MIDDPEESPVISDGPAQPASGLRGYYRQFRSSAEMRSRVNRFGTILWLVIVAVAAVWVVFQGWEELVDTYHELRAATLSWIAVAILIQLLLLVFSAFTYLVVLRRLGHRLPVRQLTDAHLQRSAISVVTPAGGPASVFMFVRYVGQRGVPAEDGLLTIGVRSSSATVTFIAALIPAALIGESIAGGTIAVALSCGIVLFGIALVKGERDGWQTPLRWSQRLPAWARSRVEQFIINFRDHGLRPGDLVPPMILALLVRMCVVGVLWASLRALDVDPGLETMLNTYFATLLASTVIPVFGGAGAVEAVSIVTLRQAGIPAEIAIGATLLWRMIDLWIPVAIGLLLHARAELPAIIPDGSSFERRSDEHSRPAGPDNSHS
ncbi:MAG: YbhN family protein [Thermomicrobiales bacterium]